MLTNLGYKKIEPASAAIIMANGIFLIGPMENFSILHIQLGKWLTLLLLILWLVIYKRLTVQFFHVDFLLPFLQHPVHSFVIGTWIAGVSVLCNVLLTYFPGMLPFIQAIGVCNTFLWCFFVVIACSHLKKIYIGEKQYSVDGAILLSTVGTQSIVILWNNVFDHFPVYLSEALILFGFLFYIAGMILLIKRYMLRRNWKLIDDWANTNCIIHGALSISGLAMASTNTFPTFFMIIFWFVVFVLLFLIECIEMIRAVLRIRTYKWKNGIFNYHVTQWSRNFTFGMFHTFTFVMHRQLYSSLPCWVQAFQSLFLTVWAWIVLLMLFCQYSVYIYSWTASSN